MINPILIVDDNLMNLKLARVLLANEGFEVLTASGAEQALAILGKVMPRLILMDIQMPGMDGLELTRRLRADARHRATQIVAFTAYAMKGDREQMLEAGCNGYISKPINPDTFVDIVSNHLPAI